MFNFDRFKQLCKARGLTQSSLFALVGKPFNYSSDLKKLKKVPLNFVEIWADALHTTPAYLMGETDDPTEGKKNKPTTMGELSAEEIEHLRLYRGATEDARRLAELALKSDKQ